MAETAKSVGAPGLFLGLGDELLCRSLAFLDIKSLAQSELTCLKFHRLDMWQTLDGPPRQRSSAATAKERVVRFELASKFAASMLEQTQSHYDFSSGDYVLRSKGCPGCNHLSYLGIAIYREPDPYEFFVRFTDRSNNQNVVWEGFLPVTDERQIGPRSALFGVSLDAVLENHSKIFLLPNGELRELTNLSVTVVAQRRNDSMCRPYLLVATCGPNSSNGFNGFLSQFSGGRFHGIRGNPRNEDPQDDTQIIFAIKSRIEDQGRSLKIFYKYIQRVYR